MKPLRHFQLRHCRALLAGVLMTSFSGCSVFMAAHASEEPDLRVLATGTDRLSVESQLGKPIAVERTRTGDLATYQYFTGDKANFNRAALYTVLDIVTLGIAELVTSPIESLQGDKHIVTVNYDLNGRLVGSNKEVSPQPIPKPEQLVGMTDGTAPATESAVQEAHAQSDKAVRFQLKEPSGQ
ncbi:MAG: hypothetical protein KDD69_07150 [Bdellovibrionales bacterium]|nr:hypothetical protein [Bdellovibrionales bacterium]